MITVKQDLVCWYETSEAVTVSLLQTEDCEGKLLSVGGKCVCECVCSWEPSSPLSSLSCDADTSDLTDYFTETTSLSAALTDQTSAAKPSVTKNKETNPKTDSVKHK